MCGQPGWDFTSVSVQCPCLCLCVCVFVCVCVFALACLVEASHLSRKNQRQQRLAEKQREIRRRGNFSGERTRSGSRDLCVCAADSGDSGGVIAGSFLSIHYWISSWSGYSIYLVDLPTVTTDLRNLPTRCITSRGAGCSAQSGRVALRGVDFPRGR